MEAQVYITDDNATPAVAALMAATRPERLALVCRDPLRGFWRDHLKQYPRVPGKFAAFPSTGFGEEAAQSVEGQVQGGAVLLTASQQGLRLRYEGGTIRPVNAKVLCFGIKEESYGKSYAEMRAQIGAQPVVTAAPAAGRGRKFTARPRTAGEVASALRGLFAFAQSVTFAPNPRVVPSTDEFQEVAMAAMERSLAA